MTTAPAYHWHGLRLVEPPAGVETRWLTLSTGKGIAAVRTHEGDGWRTQALRFRSDLWDEARAREWAASHGYESGGVWEAYRPRRGNPGPASSPASPARKGRAKRAAATPRPARPAPLDLVAYRRRPVDPWSRDGLRVGLLGELDEVILPGGKVGSVRGWEAFPVRWGVIDAGALIPSHVPGTWSKHPLYPAGVQERDYGPTTPERLKVESQILAFEPRLMLSDSRTAIDGPPLVTAGGVVLGGNSRAMTVQAIYRGPQDKAIAARDALVSYLGRSHVHGDFPRADLLGMPAPVLVRVLQLAAGEESDLPRLRDLAARANLPLTQSLEARRAASSAAARLSPEVVKEIGATVKGDEPMSEWLAGPGGVAVVDALRRASVILPRNEAQWIGRDGRLHAEGRTAALRVLAAAVVADPDLLEDLPASLMDELAASAAPILAASGSGHDVRAPLQAALRVWLDWKRSGKPWDVYAGQGELGTVAGGAGFGSRPKLAGDLDRLTFDVLKDHRGSRRMPALWRRFAQLAHEWDPATQLFEGRSTVELMRLVLGEEAGRKPNPRTERWDWTTDEADPGRRLDGPWTLPDRKVGDLVRQIAGAFPKPTPAVLVLWQRDPLGQAIPVARYKADGGKLGDPKLRLVNPSLIRPTPEEYRAAAASTATPELKPVLRWLVAGGAEPSAAAWRKAVSFLRGWADTGELRHPWGVPAIVHTDEADRSVDVLDAFGFELRLWPGGKGRAEWVEPHTRRRNPAGKVLHAADYFAKRAGKAVNPWRVWVEALLRGQGGPVDLPGMQWNTAKELIDGLARARQGMWAWGEYAWPEGPDGQGYRALRDAFGFGVKWNREGKATWVEPPPPEEGEP